MSAIVSGRIALARDRRAAPRARARRTGATGDVCISNTQRNVHVTTEAFAVLVLVPFQLWLATRPELPDWARALSFGTAVGTVIVDGGLLLSYLRQKNAEKNA